MPIYLCQSVGTGARKDRLRPPFTEPGSGWISLVPPGATSGRGVLYLPTAQSDPRLTLLADTLDERPSVTRRRALGNALGITLEEARGTRLADALAELLMDRADDRVRWRGIRGWPSKARQAHEIWLGALGRVWSEAVPPSPATKTYTETWPTNSSTISSGQNQVWTEQGADVEVSGNVLRNVGSGEQTSRCRCESLLDTANQRHRATWTLADATVEANAVAVGVRWTDDINNYYLQFKASTVGTGGRLTAKIVADVETIFSEDTTDPGTSGTMELLVDGSTVTGKQDGAIILGPTTDGSPDLTSVRTGGCLILTELLNTSGTLDTHTIADIASGIATLTLLGVQ